MPPDRRGLFEALIGDGRPLISLCGVCLGLAGGFVVFQSLTGHFLPHDVAYLRMQPEDLCGINECRIVHFMIHDRISFGGGLTAIAVLYLWLAEFPLKNGEAWSWWTLLLGGVSGFGSFLTYLGYGYFDSWHGAATLALLPCYVGGLWLTRPRATPTGAWLVRLRPAGEIGFRTSAGVGRGLLAAAACGMIGGGATIQSIGMTAVFVPTDLAFMGLDRERLDAINPRLIPLIAHDRAGFGGTVLTAGILTLASGWFGRASPALWQTLCIGGFAGWSAAVLVHPAIGYTDPLHLAPAATGAALFAAGLLLVRPAMHASECGAAMP